MYTVDYAESANWYHLNIINYSIILEKFDFDVDLQNANFIENCQTWNVLKSDVSINKCSNKTNTSIVGNKPNT